MGLKIEYIDGQTPLDDDEKEGLLIPTITTRGELDEFEQQNIERAIEWTLSRKFKPGYIIHDDFARELHHRMFGEVWKWAGTFRKSAKNIGVDWTQIATSLKQLNANCLLWIEKREFSEDETAIVYKHKIVSIHCFPNGNGRHSRLMADVIASHIFGKPVFTWNRADLNKKGEVRTNYLKALKAADKGEIKLLMQFART